MSQQVQPLKSIEMTLEDVQEEAPGVKSFFFKYDREQFHYKAGQSVLLFPEQGNPALRHPFSIASSPTEDRLMLSTKIRRESPFKTRLDTLKPGDKVNFMGPGGQFTLPERSENEIVLLGGGIGITPFRGIIKYATTITCPTRSRFSTQTKHPKTSSTSKIGRNCGLRILISRSFTL